MQRSTTFLEHFLAAHLSTVQTARDLNLDTLSTRTDSVLNSHLGSAAVSDLTLQLTCDVVANNRSIEIRFLHLIDVDLNLLLEEIFQLLAEFVNISTTLTDDNTRTSRADSDGDELQCTLDDNTRDACLFQALVEVLTNLLILDQVIAKVLATEPIRVPTADNTQAVANWINFLSHSTPYYLSSLVSAFFESTKIVTWLERLRIL